MVGPRPLSPPLAASPRARSAPRTHAPSSAPFRTGRRRESAPKFSEPGPPRRGRIGPRGHRRPHQPSLTFLCHPRRNETPLFFLFAVESRFLFTTGGLRDGNPRPEPYSRRCPAGRPAVPRTRRTGHAQGLIGPEKALHGDATPVSEGDASYATLHDTQRDELPRGKGTKAERRQSHLWPITKTRL